jgi:hypothetical protein
MPDSPLRWLGRGGKLIRLGIVAAARNPAMRLLAAVGAVSAGVVAWNTGGIPGSAAVAFASWFTRVYGICAVLWCGYAAVRDYSETTGAALRSKPVDGAQWVLVNWATAMAVWLILPGIAFLLAGLAQAWFVGPVSLLSHGVGFLRTAAAVLILATISFSLARMMRSPLGGVITMFAWFCAMAGMRFIPAYLIPEYTQNRLLYAGAAFFMLILAAFLVERHRRGELRAPAAALVGLVVALSLAGAGAALAYRSAPGMRPDERSLWEQMRRQHLTVGKQAPGFWLPDGRGGLVKTSAYRGKILFVYLFSADDLESGRTLAAFDKLTTELGGKGIQPIGICLTPDRGDGWALAAAGGHRFPIGTDLAVINPPAAPDSPMADAYYAQILPMLVVTDRRHRVVDLLTEPSYDIERLRGLARLRLEPEPD